MSGPEILPVCVKERVISVTTHPVLTERNEWDASAATTRVELVLRPRYPTQLPDIPRSPDQTYALTDCSRCPLAATYCSKMVVKELRSSGDNQPIRFSGSATIDGNGHDENPPCFVFNDHDIYPW